MHTPQLTDQNLLLSLREQEVIDFAAGGLVDKEIATELAISLATVRTYWDRIRVKLGAANRTHAVVLNLDQQRQLERAGEELAQFVIRKIEDEAIFICGKDGLLLTWSEGVKALFGYEEREWLGAHTTIFFLREEKRDADKELENADKVGASVMERWHVRKDGSRFWATNTIIPFGPEIKVASYAKIVRPKPHPDPV